MVDTQKCSNIEYKNNKTASFINNITTSKIVVKKNE